jgi:hypothetical protein
MHILHCSLIPNKIDCYWSITLEVLQRYRIITYSLKTYRRTEKFASRNEGWSRICWISKQSRMPIQNALQSEGCGWLQSLLIFHSLMIYEYKGRERAVRCWTWNVSIFSKTSGNRFSKLQVTFRREFRGLHEIRNPEYEAIWDKYTKTKS